MSQIRFDGQHAGMGVVTAAGVVVNPYTHQVVGSTKSGDRNDPMNYTLVCSCGKDLGPLGRFRSGSDGSRAVVCVATANGRAIIAGDAQTTGEDITEDGCGSLTLVNKELRIVRVLDKTEVARYHKWKAEQLAFAARRAPS